MTRIILVRHGETDWNKQERMQGQTDVPLSSQGRLQADKVAKRLKEEPISAVYSSDLSRAYHTAKTIADEHRLSVTKDADLREVDFGLWEGLHRKNVLENYKEMYHAWLHRPFEVRPPEGENFKEVQERAHKALLTIAKRHENETIVMVAHGGMIKSIICKYLDGGFWDYAQGNTAVNIVEYEEDQLDFISLNDLAHLEEVND